MALGQAAPRKSPREIEMIQKQMKCRLRVPKLDRRLGLAQLAAVIALIYFYCCSPRPAASPQSRPGLPCSIAGLEFQLEPRTLPCALRQSGSN